MCSFDHGEPLRLPLAISIMFRAGGGHRANGALDRRVLHGCSVALQRCDRGHGGAVYHVSSLAANTLCPQIKCSQGLEHHATAML